MNVGDMQFYLEAAPAAILFVASTLAGVWLVKRAPAENFCAIILALTFLIGVKSTYVAILALA